MDFIVVTEIQFIDDIDDLSQQNTVLHILVGIFKSSLYDRLLNRGLRRNSYTMDFDASVSIQNILALEYREQGVIYEFQQRITGYGITITVVNGPVAPAALFGNDRYIVILIHVPVLLLGIIDL